MFILVTLLGIILCIAGAALGTATSLYYLAEYCEENPGFVKRLILYTQYTIIGLYASLLIFSGLPFFKCAFGIACQGMMLMMQPDFPAIEFTSPVFLVSLGASLLNHFLWFAYFIQEDHWMLEIAAFYVLMIWVIPLAYLVSLVSPDSFLPTTGSAPRKRSNAIKSFLESFNLLGQSSGTRSHF